MSEQESDRAREQLALWAEAASERKYQLLVEQLNVGVLMATIDGRIVHANAATVRMTGYSSLEEFLKVRSQDLYAHENAREQFIQILAQQEQVRGFETLGVRKDGSQYPVCLGAVLLRDQAGKPEHVLGTIEDISYRKRAEEDLELLKNSIDTAPEGAYWFDATGRLVYVNDAGSRALGYSREELYELRLADINPRATPERWTAVWEALKAQKTITLESEHRRKDGSLFPVELTSTYFMSGGREYCNGYAIDITERKRSEKEREALQTQLLQAQKMESVGRLAGGVAHDFNNVLTVILAHVELGLRALDSTSPITEDLLEIRGAAERAADLTGQLLAFARRQTTAPKVLDLNASVGGMLNVLRRLIGEQIDLRWSPGLAGSIRIDPVQIYQILTNLCLNARDAISGVGSISIETDSVNVAATDNIRLGAAPGEYVRITVQDNGSGMSDEVKAHLFEPFFTTKDLGRGTGLGLATVYGIVTQNGGAIDVRSLLDGGSTFAVYLPKYLGAVAAAEAVRSHARAEGHGATVLLVEDEPAILRVAQTILERLGYRVLAAATPREALRLASDRARPIELLLTDVVMPEMNGWELSKQLTKLWPVLRTLYMSGYPADLVAHHGVLDSDVHFLHKPFTVEGLSQKVAEVLRRVDR